MGPCSTKGYLLTVDKNKTNINCTVKNMCTYDVSGMRQRRCEKNS